MKNNFSDLIKKVNERSNPEGKNYKQDLINESLNIPYNDINEYIKLSMWGVPTEYTNISKKAAEMVIKTLEKSHGKEVDFRFQGSVETNTHIWSENDVDIVQITNKSRTIDRSALNKAITESYKYTVEENRNLKKNYDEFSVYSGDQTSDLRGLRLKSESVLKNTYEEVNTNKPKAICVKMKNPKRNIDVVTATYYKPLEYLKSNQDYKKGIQIYDKEIDDKLPAEYPFWSIKLIQERNIFVQGRLKKIIRFLKNVKFDTGDNLGRKLIISSFDINAICYNIPTSEYQSLHYLELVKVVSNQLNKLIKDNEYRNALKSIDNQEFIFKDKGSDKVRDLIILRNSVDLILTGIIYQNKLAG